MVVDLEASLSYSMNPPPTFDLPPIFLGLTLRFCPLCPYPHYKLEALAATAGLGSVRCRQQASSSKANPQ